MLAKEKPSDRSVRPDEQADIRSRDLPFHGGVWSERIYLETLQIMMDTCDHKSPRNPQTTEEWEAYWAGSRCSYQHALDLYHELKLKEQEHAEHPAH